MRDVNEDRIRTLVNDIYEGELELQEFKKELNLEAAKDELKKLLVATVEPNKAGHHLVMVDGLKANVFARAGRRTVNMKKAKELLHPNTFNAIFGTGKGTLVLDTIVMVKE